MSAWPHVDMRHANKPRLGRVQRDHFGCSHTAIPSRRGGRGSYRIPLPPIRGVAGSRLQRGGGDPPFDGNKDRFAVRHEELPKRQAATGQFRGREGCGLDALSRSPLQRPPRCRQRRQRGAPFLPPSPVAFATSSTPGLPRGPPRGRASTRARRSPPLEDPHRAPCELPAETLPPRAVNGVAPLDHSPPAAPRFSRC